MNMAFEILGVCGGICDVTTHQVVRTKVFCATHKKII